MVAWLPADIAITPCARSNSPSDASLLKAPRSLNECVTCRFSYFTNTSAPVRADSLGAGSMGVRSTCPAMVRRASSTSAIVTLMLVTFDGRKTLHEQLRWQWRSWFLVIAQIHDQLRRKIG